jgi:hypothetical protein
MPLVAELAPLVWHALDTDVAARSAVAAELGVVEAPGKTLVGTDSKALAAGFGALRAHTHARQSFQKAFAARDAAADFQFPAHDALARLFHQGIAELIVSYNWDTLFERCYARRYGRRPLIDDLFWKPHGDAARPELEWILPGDAGRVPPNLLERVTALAHERPRTLVIVGYSEADERVVGLLTKPLSRRWLVCRIGPAARGELALPYSAAAVLPELAASLAPEPGLAGWEYVVFPEGRDLGSALAGRRLGPADAPACPELPEAALLTQQLRASHTARLVGQAGCGKSLSAYQAARHLSLEGWEVIRLIAPNAEERPELALAGLRFKTLALIDDAHLLDAPVLRRLEESSGPPLAVLSVSTEQDTVEPYRGAVHVDPLRAVRVIAHQLLADRARTLEAVRRADDHVGDTSLQEPLEERIRSAVEHSSSPWQFCFVLGGGWRRAGVAADAARSAGADILLAAAAMWQLASRDAPAPPEIVSRITAIAGIGQQSFNAALRRLADERLILSTSDVRCPHQRFAAVVLNRIHAGLDATARDHFAIACQSVLADPSVPLAGARVLLHELRFADSIRSRLSNLLTLPVIDALLSRCWSAHEPEQIMFGCLVLTEMQSFAVGWPDSVFADRVTLVAKWISNPVHPSGYGLARLINDIWNEDKDFARNLCGAADPEAFAAAVSSATPVTAWTVGELVGRLSLGASDTFSQRLVTSLDRTALLRAANDWPSGDLDTLAHLASSLITFDDDLGLAMLEGAESQFRTLFAKDAVEAFKNVQNDLFMHCLRVFDPLGVYRGELRPDRRRLHLERRFLGTVEPSRLAQQLSATSLRDAELSARLLSVLGAILPRVYTAAIRALDFDRLDASFGALWRDLPYDVLVLVTVIGARSGVGREAAVAWIRRNAAKIERMHPRLTALAPDVAITALEHGGTVTLHTTMTFDWPLAAAVVETVLQSRPDLVERLLGPHIDAAATALTRDQSNTYEGVDAFLNVLQRRAPTILARILDRLDQQAAEKSWAACLKGKLAPRRAAAALIASALSRGGSLGAVADRLKVRYPKASLPRPSTRS